MSRRKRYDERTCGGEWLQALTDGTFRPRSGEFEARAVDESGLVLEGDNTLNQLAMKRCSVCGQPARTSIYDLQRCTRTVLCASCRPRDEPSI